MTGRIRWNDTSPIVKAGAFGPFSFAILKIGTGPGWRLTAELPGLGRKNADSDDLDELKAEPEARWTALRDWLTGEARQCWRTAKDDIGDRPASAARFVIEAATNQGVLVKMRELESGEERTGEEEPPANGNCPALSCSHLWSLHGPDGCTGFVFPDHSPGGKPCPCERTGDGERPCPD